MKYCLRCGNELKYNEAVCPKCGYTLDQQSFNEIADRDLTKIKQDIKLSTIFDVVSSIFLFLCLTSNFLIDIYAIKFLYPYQQLVSLVFACLSLIFSITSMIIYCVKNTTKSLIFINIIIILLCIGGLIFAIKNRVFYCK